MHNYKYLCLNCLKSRKGEGICCGQPMFCLGYIARAPKINAKKSEWKEFIEYFVYRSKDKEELKRIIELRKRFNLSTSDQETFLKEIEKQEQEKEKKKTNFLYIKLNEKLLEINPFSGNIKDLNFIKTLDEIINKHLKYRTVKNKDLKHNKKYFIVPIYAKVFDTYIFPSNIEKYEIYTVRSIVVDRTLIYFKFRIKTKDLNEIIEYSQITEEDDDFGLKYWSDDEKNQYPEQKFLIFDKKENAIAFRYEYLQHIISFLEKQKFEITNKLIKKAKIDHSRIMKKYPELLV